MLLYWTDPTTNSTTVLNVMIKSDKSRGVTFWFCAWFVSHDDCMLMAGVLSLSGVSIYKTFKNN